MNRKHSRRKRSWEDIDESLEQMPPEMRRAVIDIICEFLAGRLRKPTDDPEQIGDADQDAIDEVAATLLEDVDL